MQNLERIQRFSQIMQIVCLVLIVALPGSAIWIGVNFDTYAEALSRSHGIPLRPETFDALNVALAAFVVLIPLAITIYGLLRLKALFALYRQNTFFAEANVRHLRAFAATLLANALLSPLVGALLSAILTMNNPPGQRVLQLAVGSNHVMLAFVAAVFMIIAWIMVEGRRLADENAEII